jgi:alkylhydroperoxidase family enzyme
LATDIVAGKKDLRASPRERALAGFAHVLTEVPWALTADDITHLRKVDISEEGIEQAILVTAFFNYYPRVADATGIEFDYESPLPRITVDTTREALPRFPEADWNPAVDGSTVPSFPREPRVATILAPWHAFHFERTAPLSSHARKVLARTVTENLCDSAALAQWKDVRPSNEKEERLASFAEKLTKTPWAMNAQDIDALRAVGFSDEEALAAITLIAHQNAISRMHHALAAVGQ